MRGDSLHNNVLIDSVDEEFVSLSARTFREFYIRDDSKSGFIDLFVCIDGMRIAVEAELGARRIGNDLWKARVSDANELWIVVPNSKIVRVVQKKLKNTLIPRNQPPTFLFTLGQACQAVRNRFPLIPTSNDRETTKKQPIKKGGEKS